MDSKEEKGPKISRLSGRGFRWAEKLTGLILDRLAAAANAVMKEERV